MSNMITSLPTYLDFNNVTAIPPLILRQIKRIPKHTQTYLNEVLGKISKVTENEGYV